MSRIISPKAAPMTCARNDCDRPAVWTAVPVTIDSEARHNWNEQRHATAVESCHAHLPDTLNWMSQWEADFLVRSIDGPGWKK